MNGVRSACPVALAAVLGPVCLKGGAAGRAVPRGGQRRGEGGAAARAVPGWRYFGLKFGGETVLMNQANYIATSRNF